MKKVIGISTTNKGGFWIYTSEKLTEEQRGVGERTASYHLHGEAMGEALAQAGLKNAGDLLGRYCGFDARDQYASAMFIIPANTKAT